jgi:glycosyltransferase involved in cell wall biosynthesis
MSATRRLAELHRREARPQPPTSRSARVLISTILPHAGGVPAKKSLVVQWLRERGYVPVIAYYAPYSLNPQLSVPSWKLLSRRPTSTRVDDVDGCETHAIGAWLPELEFTHYYPTSAWMRLIETCAFHIGVCGSVHALTAFNCLGLPYLGWVATGWEEDTQSRIARFPTARRFLHQTFAQPAMLALERRILRSGTILAVSDHTRAVLDSIAGHPVTRAVLPVPIDLDFFQPALDRVDSNLVGFSGRFSDARKNLPLLLEAMAVLKARGSPASLLLVGDEINKETTSSIDRLGIADRVRVLPYVSRDELAKALQTLAVYVVPSHQEGLCIAALEAMASGTPVVSTRCGGPVEYVIDDQTGYLSEFDPRSLADRIDTVLSNAELRSRLAANARVQVESRYNSGRARTTFYDAFDATFKADKA